MGPHHHCRPRRSSNHRATTLPSVNTGTGRDQSHAGGRSHPSPRCGPSAGSHRRSGSKHWPTPSHCTCCCCTRAWRRTHDRHRCSRRRKRDAGRARLHACHGAGHRCRHNPVVGRARVRPHRGAKRGAQRRPHHNPHTHGAWRAQWPPANSPTEPHARTGTAAGHVAAGPRHGPRADHGHVVGVGGARLFVRRHLRAACARAHTHTHTPTPFTQAGPPTTASHAGTLLHTVSARP
jgi:hypothetical protein